MDDLLRSIGMVLSHPLTLASLDLLQGGGRELGDSATDGPIASVPDLNHISCLITASHIHDPDGKQAGSAAAEPLGRAVVHVDGARRIASVSEPQLALRRLAAPLSREESADGFASGHSQDR